MNDAPFCETSAFFTGKRFRAAIVPAFARLTVDHAGQCLRESFLGRFGTPYLFPAHRRRKNSVFVALHETLGLLIGGQHSASAPRLPLGFGRAFAAAPQIHAEYTTRMPQMRGNVSKGFWPKRRVIAPLGNRRDARLWCDGN